MGGLANLDVLCGFPDFCTDYGRALLCSESPKRDILNMFPFGSRAVYGFDGDDFREVAPNWGALFDPQTVLRWRITHAVGGDITAFWTGCNGNGRASVGKTCSSWTSASGPGRAGVATTLAVPGWYSGFPNDWDCAFGPDPVLCACPRYVMPVPTAPPGIVP